MLSKKLNFARNKARLILGEPVLSKQVELYFYFFIFGARCVTDFVIFIEKTESVWQIESFKIELNQCGSPILLVVKEKDIILYFIFFGGGDANF